MRYSPPGPGSLLAVPLLLLPACGGEDGARAGSGAREAGRQPRAHLPLRVSAQLDSGNQAYREKDFEGAREHFRTAIRLDSAVASAWFGVYMAEEALGNQAAAREALQRADSLSGETPVPRGRPPEPSEADTSDGGTGAGS